MEKQQSTSSNSTCPRCGAEFTCDAKNGTKQCWCFDLPNVMPMEGLHENGQTYNSCLCATCLQELIANHAPSARS